MRKDRFQKSKYIPRNPNKYVGDVSNIICRSSWERKFCIWADTRENILEWSSEETIIPYFDPSTKRSRRYFVDYKVKIKVDETKTIICLVEIKPLVQTQLPKKPKRDTKKTRERYLNESLEYMKNQAKWEAAKNHCDKRGWHFVVLTEKELGITK